jgi:hypothetical protein
MSNESRLRPALSRLGSAARTASSASVLAVVFLSFRPTADDLAVPHEVTCPDTCHACASFTSETRAVRDASPIGSGAIEAPAESDSRSEGSRPVSRAALTGP